VETVLVDGTLVEVKIVEEWGYTLGEDTCLFKDEGDSEASQSDHDEGHGDPEVRRNVDTLVEKLAEGLEEEDDKESQEIYQHSSNRVDDEDKHVEEEIVIPSQDGVTIVTPTCPGYGPSRRERRSCFGVRRFSFFTGSPG
ncbi:DUF4283 domain protein, partial [Trifolium medium]|nr:DUF4283 domain protein [Trifolium medium]